MISSASLMQVFGVACTSVEHALTNTKISQLQLYTLHTDTYQLSSVHTRRQVTAPKGESNHVDAHPEAVDILCFLQFIAGNVFGMARSDDGAQRTV